MCRGREGDGEDTERDYPQPLEFLVSQEGTSTPLCFILEMIFSLTEGRTPPQRRRRYAILSDIAP
jgi:hypothetical protein